MIRAAITGIEVCVPDYVLTNEELSQMVDTTDEWIMTRIGIKERHIIREEGEGASFVGAQAVAKLLKKTNTKPEEIDFVICATVTPDYQFPATANIVMDKCGIRNGFGYDLNAGCSGFLYALATGARFIESGKYKKGIVMGAEKMSSIVDYTDRNTCCIFGDGSGAVLLEPTAEDIGVVDSQMVSDGVGFTHLHQKAGGSVKPASHETIDNREHYIYQEGQAVFKWAVSKMSDVTEEVMKRNNLTIDDIAYLIPHQANLRIIDAVGKRLGFPPEKVMVNIERYGNTTSATLALCLYEWEDKLKKGDNLILTTFGAGFTWGAIYLKWGYDAKK
ncbi:ketoacyl-ACP synthase III [Bacteroidales bacterium OttesenSCG-928-J16]|nr:ketoacyl-ACP synthase III [Bacteroidales bacterium OttesenSCG-928-J16]